MYSSIVVLHGLYARLTIVQIRMVRRVTMAGAVKLADSAQLFAQLASVLMECTSLSHALSSLDLQLQAAEQRVDTESYCHTAVVGANKTKSQRSRPWQPHVRSMLCSCKLLPATVRGLACGCCRSAGYQLLWAVYCRSYLETILLDGEVVIVRIHNQVLALCLKDGVQAVTCLLSQLRLLGLELLL
jgi:hypothetical protein